LASDRRHLEVKAIKNKLGVLNAALVALCPDVGRHLPGSGKVLELQISSHARDDSEISEAGQFER
jgi:hypothetical protein